ncbi:MAG: hypothetical protein GY908_08565 [Flavobacteriales bacterium]|nr:hypothetical protein [Flavobacteriales bacterium]
METLRTYMLPIEREYIIKALNYHNGDITKAAKTLGLSRASIYRKMEELQINWKREFK